MKINRNQSAHSIALNLFEEYEIEINERTIRKYLNERGYYKYKKVKKPKLN